MNTFYKRKMVFLLMVFLLSVSIFMFACKNIPNDPPDDTPEWISSDWTEMPENTNENLKYFGYFHSDGFLGSLPYFNEISALQNSNVMMINSAWSIEQSVNALATAKELGHKALMSVHDFFDGGQVSIANSATLKSDYEEKWNARREAIASYIEDGTVLGFYFDEPAWNGVKEEDFRLVTSLLREQYPNLKVMNCLTVYDVGIQKHTSYPEMNASYNEYCTDIMYDSYANWNDEIRREYLEKLKTKATNNQFIWGCPKGFSDNPEQIDQMVKHIKGYYTEAIQEPRYAGIISFSFANGFEGDWGYGLTSFFDEDNEYYSRELKRLYINIGREVIGLEPYDFSQDVELTVIAPQEIYLPGDEVTLPLAGALDGQGNPMTVSYELTDPRGNQMSVDSSFTALYSGKYVVKVSAGEGEHRREKTADIYVRYPDEISLFDSSVHTEDASGTDADKWCWPRSVTNDFKYSGEGSLFVNTHPTDGEWPRIIFARDGYQLWDMTKFDAISCWIYNPSEQPLKGIKYFITNEAENKEKGVYYGNDIPSKEWTQVVITKAFIQSASPELDLSKLKIIIGQCDSSYVNRTPFYIDEVRFLKETYDFDFENEYDVNNVTGTESDLWCWPTSISNEQAFSGEKSLKVTPHLTDGTWPSVVFSSGFDNLFDLTNIDAVSVMVYNPSDDAINGFGLKINNGEGVNQAVKTFVLSSKIWTEFKITKDEILVLAASIDLSRAQVSLSQLGGTYQNRTAFYIDSFNISKAEEQGTPISGNYSLGFENAEDINAVTGTPDDKWTWPNEISDEQAHLGDKSLKVNTHATDGTWPNIVFNNGDFMTFNLIQLDYISIWVYNPSDSDISGFGLKVNNGEKTNEAIKVFDLPSKEWTKFKFTKEEILTLQEGIDLENAKVSFVQAGSTYDNRTVFYLDDFEIVII